MNNEKKKNNQTCISLSQRARCWQCSIQNMYTVSDFITHGSIYSVCNYLCIKGLSTSRVKYMEGLEGRLFLKREWKKVLHWIFFFFFSIA